MPTLQSLLAKKNAIPALIMFGMAAVGVAAYVNLNSDWIVQTTAVPTYDQGGYFIKTLAIARTIQRNFFQALNPLTYLSEPFANRPPLMMALSAWVFGPTFNYSAIAMLWFATRVLGLLLVLVMMARRVRNAWWLPAAVLAIICTPGWLRVYPNILMMDQPFEVAALLAFAGAVWDFQTRTWKSALGAVLGFLVAIGVKAAAPIMFFPWFVFLGWQLVRGKMRGARLIVYIGGALMLVGMALSPFGPAVVTQYIQGMQGWWHFPLTWVEKLQLGLLIVQPWLLVALIAGAVLAWKNKSAPAETLAESADDSAARQQRYVAWAAAIMVAWWFIFNAWISYTMDARIVPAAMPIATVGICLWIARTWKRAMVMTVISAAVCFWAMAIAAGYAPASPVLPWVTAQKPIKEVGVYAIAQQLQQTCPPQSSLLINIDDHLVETTSISLAWAEAMPQAQMPKLGSPIWGITPNLASRMSHFNFILLKKKNSTSELAGNSWASLHAVEDLVRMPESPISKYYTPVWTLPTHQPGYDDEVTLYYRTQTIAPEDLAAGDKFADQRMGAK